MANRIPVPTSTADFAGAIGDAAHALDGLDFLDRGFDLGLVEPFDESRIRGNPFANRAAEKIVVPHALDEATRGRTDVFGIDQAIGDEPVWKRVLERIQNRLGSRLDPAAAFVFVFAFLLGTIFGLRGVHRFDVFEQIAPIVESEACEIVRCLPPALAPEVVHAAEQDGIRPKHLRHAYRLGELLRRGAFGGLSASPPCSPNDSQNSDSLPVRSW